MFLFNKTNKNILFFSVSRFYQKTRFERLSSSGYHPGDQPNQYVGTSAANTVVRKIAHPLTSSRKYLRRLSSSLERTSRSNSSGKSRKVSKNKCSLEQEQQQSSIKNKSNLCQNHYEEQQRSTRQNDIETLAMKQFHTDSMES